MWTMFVEGKDKGVQAIHEEQIQKLNVVNKIAEQQLQEDEQAKAEKEAIPLDPEVQQQINTVARTEAERCKQAYIEHFQRLIKEAPTTDKKKTLLEVMKQTLGDQQAFTENLHTHLVNLFVVHVKDVVTTVGAGNAITIADIAKGFGKEGIA